MAELIKDEKLEGVSGGMKGATGSFVYAGDHIIYNVAPDDNLSSIGVRFGVNYLNIAAWNGIANPDFIRAGQKLIIYPQIIR